MATNAVVSNIPDIDLITSNIKDGIDIFGVVGNLSPIPPLTPLSWNTFAIFDILAWTYHTGTDENFKQLASGIYETPTDIYFLLLTWYTSDNWSYSGEYVACASIAKMNKTTLAYTYYKWFRRFNDYTRYWYSWPSWIFHDWWTKIYFQHGSNNWTDPTTYWVLEFDIAANNFIAGPAWTRNKEIVLSVPTIWTTIDLSSWATTPATKATQFNVLTPTWYTTPITNAVNFWWYIYSTNWRRRRTAPNEWNIITFEWCRA